MRLEVMDPCVSIKNPTIWTTVKEVTCCFSQTFDYIYNKATSGHFKDTKIRDTLLQVIIFLNFDLFKCEHLCFWQRFSQRHVLSPRNIAIWRRMYKIPRITLYHAIERKWLIWNWARITATPVGMEEHHLKEYSTLAFTLVYTLNTLLVQ